mmetsp:Transcript_36864/g.85016  ORF Transcript_36864/g.85016 Transcript_36864/m.85016 type:complete len:235 (-) Transcript_36864:191-895(-)
MRMGMAPSVDQPHPYPCPFRNPFAADFHYPSGHIHHPFWLVAQALWGRLDPTLPPAPHLVQSALGFSRLHHYHYHSHLRFLRHRKLLLAFRHLTFLFYLHCHPCPYYLCRLWAPLSQRLSHHLHLRRHFHPGLQGHHFVFSCPSSGFGLHPHQQHCWDLRPEVLRDPLHFSGPHGRIPCLYPFGHHRQQHYLCCRLWDHFFPSPDPWRSRKGAAGHSRLRSPSAKSCPSSCQWV